MSSKIIALASDHAGFELKETIKKDLQAMGRSVLDLGTDGLASVDYPDYGKALGEAISEGRADQGVAVCGSGIGISIAANRIPGVRAALCHDALTAKLSRQHNDANVLALGSRVIGIETARDCVRVFFGTEFEGGRHAARVNKLG